MQPISHASAWSLSRHSAVNFKLDENLPEVVLQVLTGLGHDAQTVAQEGLAGAVDEDVLRTSITEQRVLVTLDLDFSDIRAYPPGSHAGIWVLRPPKQTFSLIADCVKAAVKLAATERTSGQLWIIDARSVRIRDA